MLEIIVFAVALVMAQMLGGFMMLGIMFSKPFAKYYAKKAVQMTQTLTEEMEKNLYED